MFMQMLKIIILVVVLLICQFAGKQFRFKFADDSGSCL
jgi:hypothetical protein